MQINTLHFYFHFLAGSHGVQGWPWTHFVPKMTLSSQPYLLSVGDTGRGHHVWLPSSFFYPTVLHSHLLLFIYNTSLDMCELKTHFFPHEHSVPERYLFMSHLCISALVSSFFLFGNRGWIRGLTQVSLHSSIERPPALPLQDVGLLANPRAWIYSKWVFVTLHIVIKCKNKTQKQRKGERVPSGSRFVGTVFHGGRNWGQLVTLQLQSDSRGRWMLILNWPCPSYPTWDPGSWDGSRHEWVNLLLLLTWSWQSPTDVPGGSSTQQSQILRVRRANHPSMRS